MDVEKESDTAISNYSLETEHNYIDVKYSEDNINQTFTDISKEADHHGINFTNLQDEFFELYLKPNLGLYITLAVAYMLIFVIGIVGNCMVILVLIKRPQMRTVTNMLIMNLAVADLLVIIFCVPVNVISNFFWPWILGQVMCKGVSYVQGVSVCASAYSLAAISLDRCKAICHPLMPPIGLSKRQALFTICLIWTIAMTLTIPWAVILNVATLPGDRISFCIEMWENKLYGKIYFLIVFLILFYCFPLIATVISNLIIWYNVSKRKVPEESASVSCINRMHRESRQSVGKMLGIVTLVFLLSWLPLYFLATKDQLIKNLSSWEFDIVFLLAQMLSCSNSSINPILYAFLNKNFREMFRSLLPKWMPCIHKTENTNMRNNAGIEQS